ncbi:Hypothetical_protein [Hexamita inflata]|uniref:Hypothetical_protein n=1 Tax=Hexamita inflata TaxID=28002 RepID=A0AA86N736_9EUKA|nr:Hypothetical protein HINF_LOCUS1747 [Hexamita inflata]
MISIAYTVFHLLRYSKTSERHSYNITIKQSQYLLKTYTKELHNQRLMQSSGVFQQLRFMQLHVSNMGPVVFNQACTNQINLQQPIYYCIKATSLSSKTQKDAINISPKIQTFHSLYTQSTQDLELDLTVSARQLPSFALFGITTQIQVQNSQLSVRVPDSLSEAALVCFTCDAKVLSSTLLFVASAQNISGIVGNAQNYLVVSESLIQFRLAGDLVGGLVNLAVRLALQLAECNISGYFSGGSKIGTLVSVALEAIQVQVIKAAVCANVPNYVGMGENLIQYDSAIVVTCDVCGNLYHAHGICQAALANGEVSGQKLVCKNTFIFDGDKCACPDGYIFNVNICVNILEKVDSMLNLQQQIDLKANTSDMQASVQNIYNEINQLKLDSMTNILELNQSINILNDSIKSETAKIYRNISASNNTIDSLTKMVLLLKDTITDMQNQIIDLNQDQQDEMDTSDLVDLVCFYQAFSQSFDIAAVTNSIYSSNFSGAFVFDDGANVNNAFLEVTDNSIQAASFSIFRSQTYFYNLKIQLGTQNLLSGSIVAESGVQMVNKMSIISRASSTLQVHLAQVLNILSRTSSGSEFSIRNLLVNLAFASGSAGSVDLIYTASGALNVRNYQVVGSYYSSQSSCLGAFNTVNGQVSLQNVNFNPTVFTFGNTSSYLFAVFTQSLLQIQKIVISVGVSTANPNIITSISSSATSQFVFGGIVAVSSQSQIDLQTSAFKVFSQFDTAFQNYTGQICGQLIGANIVSVSHICYQESAQLQAASKVLMGAIGLIEGVFSLAKTSIAISLAGDANIQGFGTVAFTSQLNSKSIFSDLTLQVQLGAKTTTYDEQNVSALVGRHMSLSWTVQNIVLNDLLLQRGKSAGGIIGFGENGIGLVQNVIVENSTISTSSYLTCISGGMIGQISGSTVNIQSINMNNVVQSASGTDYCSTGIIIGYTSAATIQIDELNVNQYNISSSVSNLVTQTGLIAFMISSKLSLKATTMFNCNATSISTITAKAHNGCVVAQANTTSIIIKNYIFMNNNITALAPKDTIASAIVGNINANSDLIAQNIIIRSSTMYTKSIASASYGAFIICLIQQSRTVLQQIQVESSILTGGTSSSSIQGVAGLVTQSNLTISQSQLTDSVFTSVASSTNSTVGGFLAKSMQSNITISTCEVGNITITSYTPLYSHQAGFIGSLIQSNLTQTYSIVQYSNITGSSSLESTSAGFLAYSEYSNASYTCNTVFNSTTFSYLKIARTSLFVGALDYSFLNLTSMNITNSVSYCKSSIQARNGGLFARIYNSTVYSTQTYLTNVKVTGSSTTDAIAGGFSGWTFNSTIIISMVQLTQVNITAQSNTSLSVVGGMFAVQNSADVNISMLTIEMCTFISIASATTQFAYSSAITGQIDNTDALNNGSLNITHVKITSVFINAISILSGSSYQNGGMIIGNQVNTKATLQFTDSFTDGLNKIQTVVVANCAALTVSGVGDNGC